jgi:hypothetical protein
VDTQIVGTENLASQMPSRAEQWRLIGAAALLVVGVFSDGYAHSNFVDELESFITPWHGLIFAGFLACLGVITVAVRARLADGRRLVHAVPTGWNPAAVGIALFALGFIGDGVWHTIYGIEADLEALLSPTHLMMLAGGLGVMSGPLLANWQSEAVGRQASFVELGPVIAAMTLIMATVSFFLIWTWPVNNGHPLESFNEFAADNGDVESVLHGLGRVSGVAAYLVFAVILVAPILLFGRRWDIPSGATLVITTGPWILMNAAFMSFFAWQRLIPAVVGALCIEFLLRTAQRQERVWTWRVLGAAFPLIVFGLDMVVLELVWSLGWPPELVAGTVLASAFVGYGVSILVHPPAVPRAC